MSSQDKIITVFVMLLCVGAFGLLLDYVITKKNYYTTLDNFYKYCSDTGLPYKDCQAKIMEVN